MGRLWPPLPSLSSEFHIGFLLPHMPGAFWLLRRGLTWAFILPIKILWVSTKEMNHHSQGRLTSAGLLPLWGRFGPLCTHCQRRSNHDIICLWWALSTQICSVLSPGCYQPGILLDVSIGSRTGGRNGAMMGVSGMAMSLSGIFKDVLADSHQPITSATSSGFIQGSSWDRHGRRPAPQEADVIIQWWHSVFQEVLADVLPGKT